MKLKRGVNLGGWLSQCVKETEHYETFITREDIKNIAKMGFDHVRLPIDHEVFENADGSENARDMKYVQRAIDWCSEEGLNIILDLHKAAGYDFNDAGDKEKNNLFNTEELKIRFLELWKRIAGAYGHNANVAFELLNEVVEKENADAWNELIAKAVKSIREVNKDTLIIYGGIQWNSVKTLKLLDKPADKNVLYTFHFYEPLIFTHQKAPWVANMDPDEEISYPESMSYYDQKSEKLGFQGEVARQARSKTMGPEFMEEMVCEAIAAAKAAGVGLYCGEFGVIDRAPTADTLRWFKDVDAVFKKYDIGFSVWSYKQMDFGITDEHYKPIKDEMIKLWMRGGIESERDQS